MERDGTLEAYHQAREAWPAFHVPEARFRARVAGGPAPARPGDLYLSLACEAGDAAALAAFEREVMAPLRGLVARAEADPAVVDEVLQQVRVRVLVADGDGPPRLAGYTGAGSLLSWLKVTALRLHADLHRAARRGGVPVGSDVVDVAASGALPPERLLLDARWGAVLREALSGALRALPPRERALLRLHYVEGLSLEQVGRTYGVHKSTVSRWLAAARDALLTAAREAVGARVDGADAREVQSLCEDLCSRLALSLSALHSVAGAAVGDGLSRG
ncbi:MAG: sigma-70 family RNA polymerase sigma factor [Deltaproteobacteria bacterium]|nr:sigma-70 family RNA polymerase sigma factor [Deltaproteobacteria bacterium]